MNVTHLSFEEDDKRAILQKTNVYIHVSCMMCIHACRDMHIFTYIYTYTCIYIYIYTSYVIHTYTHFCVFNSYIYIYIYV